jgi:hypothetical protein
MTEPVLQLRARLDDDVANQVKPLVRSSDRLFRRIAVSLARDILDELHGPAPPVTKR